jgi:two-component system alkaline phosphatase synthesis response regulator PhoP
MTAASRRVLVVEDDPAIRRGVVAALSFAGYKVLEAADGPRGLELAETAEVDLVLLDVVLPGTDGLEILRRVRESRPTRPVILMTARAAEDDRVGGLAAGADDYVVKPFSVRELLARVEAVLRRSPERPRPVEVIECDDLVIDLPRREIRHADGARFELSEKEAELAAYLAANAGRTISREELLRRVWRLDPRGVTTRTIDMHVMRLREKLRDDTAAPRRVLTVRGQGYAWAAAEAGR